MNPTTPPHDPLRATTPETDALAHELWAMAQLLPGEGITDAVDRMVERLNQDLTASLRALEEAETALTIYANPKTYEPESIGGFESVTAIGMDRGDIARAALARIRAAKSNSIPVDPKLESIRAAKKGQS